MSEVEVSKLRDACLINPRAKKRPSDDEAISFLPMAAVNAENGTTSEGEDRPFGEVKKGYTYFEDGDILFAKITPCFENGKIAQARIRRRFGVGSTEFHVIRPDRARASARYILHFLRQQRIRELGERRMTGSGGQRRVPEAFVADLEIRLPEVEEQRRIAEVLDRADELRATHIESLSRLDELTQSTFLDMFGDLTRNPLGWPVEGVETVCCLIVDCVNRTAPTVDNPTPFKMIRTSNVRAGKVSLENCRYVTEEVFRRWNRRATPRRGDVVLTREAPVGESGILDSNESVFLGQRLMLYRVDPQKATPEYFSACFRSSFLRRQFLRGGSGSTVKHLSLPACRSLEIPVPPIHLQREFSRRVQFLEKLKVDRLSALRALDELFASLQDRAFRGEL
ncbi:restriction endonuclease subunit S [Plantactinospora sp. ZYX-F-223]|uniref:restriction endonuclease subunit S n=1 Tax=Plantactinospora sp. ZYX-F-223 TaxID=3144103 RepID=UPI0031FDAE0D